MKNNLTLLVDANWLLISRASVLIKSFQSDLPMESKIQAQQELEDLLAKSICVILNKLPVIDNVIIVADGGSWRKQLPVPGCIEGTTYKGNRTKTEETDWDYIYKSLNNVLHKAKDEGVTVSQYNNIEGDDWVWYWSRRLNNEGTNCIIWSSDNDLKQLIQVDEKTNTFTAWYNDKNGLWLPSLINDCDFDGIDFFMNPTYYSPVLEGLKSRIGKSNYINPDDIVMSKIICGDAGDNILPIMRYCKNNRIYRITEKDWDSIKGELAQINNINDFNEHVSSVIGLIATHKKFKPYNPDASTLNQMIEYNTKLVWLNENTIPDTIIQFMNQQEYKQFDVSYIKSNYKVLTNNSEDYMEKLFSEI